MPVWPEGRGRPGSDAAGMFTSWSPTVDAPRGDRGGPGGARRRRRRRVLRWSKLAAATTRSTAGAGAEHRRPRAQAPATQDLGFPAFATKNTTRVAGVDPVADAAGVALAAFPSTGGRPGPAAVSLVDADDWAAGIAAAASRRSPSARRSCSRAARRHPRLSRRRRSSALAPTGLREDRRRADLRDRPVAAPHDLETRRITVDPAAIAAAIDRLRQKLTGAKPQHIVLASSDQPAYAMPAAGWAARSGRPRAVRAKGAAPKPTLAALRRDKRARSTCWGQLR